MKGKRVHNWIQGGILAILAGAVLFTFFLQHIDFSAVEPERVEISIVIRQSSAAALATARQGMEQAAGDLGAELRFLVPDQDNDSAQQLALLRREVEGGSNAIVVVPAGQQTLLQPGVPLVLLEMEGEHAAAAVTPDNHQLGAQLGRAIAGDYPAGGQVTVLSAQAEVPALQQRELGLTETLVAAGFTVARWNGADEDYHPAEGEIVAACDQTLLEWAVLHTQAGETAPAFYGIGFSGNIAAGLEQGVITAVAAWNEYAAGYLAVSQAVQAARGEQAQSHLLQSTIIRGEDLYAPEHQRLLFPINR